MVERTEEQVLFNEGMEFKIGVEVATIKKLTIAQTRKWLRRFMEWDGSVFANVLAAAAEDRSNVIGMLAGFDGIENLIIDYSQQSLTLEQLENGYPEQLAKIMDTLLEVSGFFDLVWGKTARMKQGLRI